MPRLQVSAGQHFDVETRGERLAPLLLYCFAFSRIQRREEVIEIAVSLVGPVELLAEPLQKSRLGQRLGLGGGGKVHAQRPDSAARRELDHSDKEMLPGLRPRRL